MKKVIIYDALSYTNSDQVCLGAESANEFDWMVRNNGKQYDIVAEIYRPTFEEAFKLAELFIQAYRSEFIVPSLTFSMN